MWQPGVRTFVLIPAAINVLTVAGLFLWLWPPIEASISAWLLALPDWLAWLSVIVWPLVWILGLLLFGLALTFLANLIASPFNGFLAARVERQLTGKSPESGMTIGQEAVHGLLMELRKLLFYLSRALPLMLLSLVLFFLPGLNALIPLLWLGFGAYMLALEYVDYPASNHGLSFAHKRALLSQQRGLCLGFGAAATVLSMIPLANLLVMPAAVAGATALWVEQLSRESGLK